MRSRSLVLALLLAGCGSDPTCPPPGIRYVTQEKVVETQKPCAAKLPDAPAKLSGPVPKDAQAAVPILLAKLAEFFGNPDTGKPGYIAAAEKQMAICHSD
jgi:hypothetical protein